MKDETHVSPNSIGFIGICGHCERLKAKSCILIFELVSWVKTMENLLIYWQRGNITPSYFCKYRFFFLSLSLKSDHFGFQIDSCVLFCMDLSVGVSYLFLWVLAKYLGTWMSLRPRSACI